MQNLETRQLMASFGRKLSVNTHCNTGHSYGQHEGQISSDEEQLNMKVFFHFVILFYFILFWQCALAGKTETPMTDYFVLPYKEQY